MKYMLLTYLDEHAWLALTEEERQAEMTKCEPHVSMATIEVRAVVDYNMSA